MKCIKNITLAAMAICATQTLACMAPTDEDFVEEAGDASALAYADGDVRNCASALRGEFELHDDGRGAHLVWKDSCAGSDVVLWIETPDPEQPLYGEVDVVGLVEGPYGIIGEVDGWISVSADSPQRGRLVLAIGRPGVDVGLIDAAIGFDEPAGQPSRVDGDFRLY